MVRQHLRTTAAGLSALLLATACSTTEPTPEARSTAPATHPADRWFGSDYDRRQAAAFVALRALDPCALHSPQDLQQIMGMTPDELMPAGEFDVCRLRLRNREFDPGWDARINVAARWSAGSGTETVGGLQVSVQEDNAHSCTVSRPLPQALLHELAPQAVPDTSGNQARHAISLTVSWSTRSEAPPTPPCQVTRDYLTAVADAWRQPPRRDQHRTTPALPLAGVDPCAAAPELAGLLPGSVKMTPLEPYSCTLRKPPPAPLDTPSISVRLALNDDPVEQARTARAQVGLGRPTTIAGRPGTLGEGKGPFGSFCLARIRYADDPRVRVDESREDTPVSVQVVEVRAPGCEQAQKAVEAVLATAGVR
ncbi:hypothetical protein GCM10012275_43130 [Longimycelium tulufanense]|uniref:Uncharacterized protein n=1 Tax=Longimycelium tulufanense TaxID=907463 RepID=A0A8J3FWN6_9PSEU|nr:hypothetical protein [Longimycelium tulufanense]GGM67937.1 hypothetical protein GCM10012275_43130 [Longimycelium tulufanense]